MSKFVCVEKAPKDIRKGEYVVDMPDFIQELKASRAARAAGSNKLTQNNSLRNALVLIGTKYDDQWNAYSVPIGNYEGIPYSDENDLSAIVLKILYKHGPSLIDGYIVRKIRERPLDTKIIYFTGPFEKTEIFQKEGIDRLAKKDVDSYLKLESVKAKPSNK